MRTNMARPEENIGQPQPTAEQQRRERRQFIKGVLVGGGATLALASLGDFGLNAARRSRTDKAIAGIKEELNKRGVTPPDPKNLEAAKRIDARVHGKPVAERDSVDYSSLVWSEKIKAEQTKYDVASQVAKDARVDEYPSAERIIGDVVGFTIGASAMTEGVLLPDDPRQDGTLANYIPDYKKPYNPFEKF
jgi:hypothetical protein